ncbi:hypothetical protein JOC36_000890 [Weissella uvarum]|uniref:hypothetical protein n=1 Tax=Weissella uvarum TaxID=1479233 RepID=UPI001960EE82|nr:hypothetical protein [Weissella uvarum]MBM7617333.1 hypothetical protein [Weissella uvarum]MCM0595775.1 hypothetical protein [Weissella uvarum]
MDDEDAWVIAERFFRQDYHDRGMVKWQGFYLSDHTEDVAHYTQTAQEKRNQKQMPEMDIMDISDCLLKAYQQSGSAQYQLKGKNELGFYAPVVKGKVSGYQDEDVFIDQNKVALENIQWCALC